MDVKDNGGSHICDPLYQPEKEDSLPDESTVFSMTDWKQPKSKYKIVPFVLKRKHGVAQF